ncbi:Pet127-domain-containing protein [Astrocystis sublimbata]|nr:Pet127-domain-containing protein [Astrocystis sublimbata]
MLRFGRCGPRRLPNSYICLSCRASSHSPFVTAPRLSLARHHARPLSTTVPRWNEATPDPANAAVDIKPGPQAPPAESPAESPTNGSTEPPTEPSARKEKKKKRKKRPTNATLDIPNEPPGTDPERQLLVLRGALESLKHVLTSQGVDVSQIPRVPAAAAVDGVDGTKDKFKSKPKYKPNPKSKSKSQSKPQTEPQTEPKAEYAPKAKRKLKHNLRPEPAHVDRTRKNLVETTVRRVVSKRVKQVEVEPTVDKPLRASGPPATVNPKDLSLLPIETLQPDVPSLSYDLERVLFNPGVYQLQDLRTRVFNFDPYLSEIMPVNEFDFNALKEYVTSSKDSTLITIAKEHNKKYTGSTSSMTSMLAHFHFLLSSWREINTSMMSRGFIPESLQYTRIMRSPAAIFLHWKNGTYAIDADKEFDTANVLSMLGKSMEKLLTLSKDDYERYRRENSGQISEEERNAEEAFHYTGFQDFMMRSQLDAYDPRVPGTGMFDLKTRAVITIRMDAKGYEKGLGYEIRQRHGQWESFEREYYDMIRSAFLKYSLQVRMGRMDGIFVAFHNTQRIFGFQYIPLKEMDLALHGSDDTLLGDGEFKLSLKLLNEVLDRASQKWPEQSLRLHFETRPSAEAPFMYIFAEPTNDEEIAAVQNVGKASVEEFERNILGLVKRTAQANVEHTVEADDTNNEELDKVPPTPTEQLDSLAAWQEARQMVEEAMGDDELGVGLVKEAIADALEQSGIVHARSVAESREYVDALLGALTGRSLSSHMDAAGVGSNEETAANDDDSEEQDLTGTQEAPVRTPADAPVVSDNEQSSAVNQGGDTEETLKIDSSAQENAQGSIVQQPTDNVGETDLSNSPLTTPEESVEKQSTPNNEQIDTTTDSIADDQKESEETAEEDEDENEDEDTSETELEDASEIPDSNEDGASANLEPLKGLIMRMARRLDEKTVLKTDPKSPLDDASKLKDFERILGRLISESRSGEFEGASGDGRSDKDKPSEAGAMNNDLAAVPQSSEDAPTISLQPDVALSNASEHPQSKAKAKAREILGLTLTIKNKVNGKYVDRPSKLRPSDDWAVEYEIADIDPSRAERFYNQVKERRRKALLIDAAERDIEWYKMFQGNLEKFTNIGREFRKQESRKSEGRPLHMVGFDEPLQWEDVFRRPPKIFQAPNKDPETQQVESKEERSDDPKNDY